jgi:glycosyltransferase involved in cell wall biosynthesis
MPKVSVIIPTFNCVQYLERAIESALNQTFKDFEILVIDDGSTDNTHDLVKEYIKRSNQFRYIYQENKGLAVARNTGLQHACGEFIALLDADDAWYPALLEKEVKLLESDSSLGLVHANVTKVSETDEPLTVPARNKEFLTGNIFNHLFLREADILCPTALFRKSCCEEVGDFDVNLTRLGCEDRELWLRIAEKYKIAYIDEPLAYYRVRTNSMSRNNDKMLQARLYVIDKYCTNNKYPNLKNKALQRIYRDLGDMFLCGQNFSVAKNYYLQSIALSPVTFWPWVNLIKALLKIKVKKVYY